MNPERGSVFAESDAMLAALRLAVGVVDGCTDEDLRLAIQRDVATDGGEAALVELASSAVRWVASLMVTTALDAGADPQAVVRRLAVAVEAEAIVEREACR